MKNEIINQWHALSPNEQVNMLTACIRSEMGKHPRATGCELDELVSEAWIRITEALTPDRVEADTERRKAEGKQPRTLISTAYNAATAAIMAATREQVKYSVAQSISIQSDDGGTTDLLDLLAAPEDVESTVAADDILTRIAQGRNAADLTIIAGLLGGETERQIAESIGISGPAVHKRIVKLRATAVRYIA